MNAPTLMPMLMPIQLLARARKLPAKSYLDHVCTYASKSIAIN